MPINIGPVSTPGVSQEDSNLADLFSTLNQISSESVVGQRAGGGTGGGSIDTVGNMDPNPLIRLNPYIAKNVTSFHRGGLFGNLISPITGAVGNVGNTTGGIGNAIGGTLGGFFGSGIGSTPTGGTNVSPIGGAIGGVINPVAGTTTGTQTTPTEPATTVTNPAFGSIGGPMMGGTTTTTQPTTTAGESPTIGGFGGILGQSTPSTTPANNLIFGGLRGLFRRRFDEGGKTHNLPNKLNNWKDMVSVPKSQPTIPSSFYVDESGTRRIQNPRLYEQQANQMIALNQIGNVVRGLSLREKMLAPELRNMPMANKGMKMRKRYTQGGRF